MTPSIELFDANGGFVMPAAEDLDSAPQEVRDAFQVVQDAREHNIRCDAAHSDARTRVHDLMTEITTAERDFERHHKAQNREAAVREFLATERARRGV
jgi:hypothetical protein